MVGANTYACGTAVKAGMLAVESGASLPADQFLRVDADGVLDLGGNSQTATALLGTGKVKSGSLAVTEAVASLTGLGSGKIAVVKMKSSK